MRVLVTGGAGFIGSHVVDQLIEEGHELTVIDNLSTGKLENINKQARFYKENIESDSLMKIMDDLKPEVVVHLAAQIDVQKSLMEPGVDADINIGGTINLLGACTKAGVKKLVYASSAAVYGDPVYLSVDESHPICPLSPYGISKYTPEQYIRVLAATTELNYTILRFANVYGTRQDPKGEGGVVSIFVDKLLKGESPKIYGDGEQTRDFIYVNDVARAVVSATKLGEKCIVNVSTNTATTINSLFLQMTNILNLDIKANYELPRQGDIIHSYLENKNALSLLDWTPKTSLYDGLNETLNYYKELHKETELSLNA
ncbi:NAD-dependent epimerase/dehydratase family protein [Paenibacillus chitinolyticus]|uniref:NAD-dependent epimerase/dehydratase family protein n=1 Tax=Paenibacillus chitinolyticus TaxID=79263 RepID=UPI003869AF4C